MDRRNFIAGTAVAATGATIAEKAAAKVALPVSMTFEEYVRKHSTKSVCHTNKGEDVTYEVFTYIIEPNTKLPLRSRWTFKEDTLAEKCAKAATGTTDTLWVFVGNVPYELDRTTATVFKSTAPFKAEDAYVFYWDFTDPNDKNPATVSFSPTGVQRHRDKHIVLFDKPQEKVYPAWR
jgi:hypothetical protein